MNPYCRIIPRLNGLEIEDRFDYYLSLVKKGVAGFIVFGGELETVRGGLKKLHLVSDKPLIIASDLEQGLGQQINGGTIFPPAMAIASAARTLNRKEVASLLNRLYTAISLEAKYAGINTILAPVLDVNTNPENPIISTRSFGEDPDSVSFFGCEMIRILQKNKIMACGKHFPGHGDTETDSHINLPVIKKDLPYLENNELRPFKKAIDAGVNMIMLGHLSVPSIEPSGIPVSLSDKAVLYLKERMGFKGIVITDAMNMGGIRRYTEEHASLMALKAGVDIILHPTDPDNVASYLLQKKYLPQPLTTKPDSFRSDIPPDFSGHKELSEELAKRAIKTDGSFKIKKPFVIILDDSSNDKGLPFIDALKKRYPHARHRTLVPGEDISRHMIPPDHDLIVCVFSEVKAWKGNTSLWLYKAIAELKDMASIFISFGNPYVLRNLQKMGCGVTKIYAFWDSETAQGAVVEKLINSPQGPS